MSKKLCRVMLITGLYIMGGIIIKKLDDVQKEIEYFEVKKDVWHNRKEDVRIREQQRKEWEQVWKES